MRKEQSFQCANVAAAGANIATLAHRKPCANIAATGANVVAAGANISTLEHWKHCASLVAKGANGAAAGANVTISAPATAKALRYSLECLTCA